MHLILTGATGLVGSATLEAMLKMRDISKISIVSRRPVPFADHMNDPRVNVIIHKDFTDYPPEVLNQLRGANGAVWALGVSQSQVPKEEYIKITRDYTIAGAKAFESVAAENEPFRFIFVSGYRVTQQPGHFTSLYCKYKGEAESLLSEIRVASPSFEAESVRPNIVDSTAHTSIKPFLAPPIPLYRLVERFAMPSLRLVGKGMIIPSDVLGKFLAEAAMGKQDDVLREGGPDIGMLEGGMRVVENKAIRNIVGI